MNQHRRSRGSAEDFDLETTPKIVPHGVFPAVRLTGSEQMASPTRGTVGPSVMGLWQWASSNLFDNTMRGMLAEHMVATALGAADEGIRTEWDAFDLETESGLKVEIKSCAFLQSWAQETSSAATIRIRETLAWDQNTARYEDERRRQADVYVVCVFTGTDISRDDILDLDLWTFLVAPTTVLNKRFPGQKTVRLTVLAKTPGISRCRYDELKRVVYEQSPKGN